MPNLEIERKWLIARPDPAILAAQPGAAASEIVQTYLTAPDGVSRRVRARTAGGITTYTRTTKHRIDAMTADEDEAVIPADEYTALLRDADPACRPIAKTRWCIPHAGQTLEIDLYPFWDKQAVLEIELPAPDAPVEPPGWLTVLCEVTGDRAYSNHSLARRIPDEIA
ncbi:MAG: hypothetical protein IJX53_08295 [Clostridia bacterium]|nr:hypothetical protein [Clostridia bacterium]